ncbi:hypothetical protein BKA63DRAFT_457638 [Paraphoma chrysanthemicola]|nr:hypothetical protein BKA63DRAFT_457638 [Paraphoma chrysanthemicola]
MSQAPAQITTSQGSLRLSSAFPERLPSRFKNFPKLSREQCGHLRHYHNLASLIDGEFALMGHQDPSQEWETSYRYQFSAMAYAAGAAHYHRLPAMRAMFKSLIHKLIKKMLRREVWGYWYLTSQGCITHDPDLTELRKPWADPVVRENIMYSGHLLLMVSLYSMLFADNSFDEPDGIVFDWDPMFWGFGPEKFVYSRSSLHEVILKEMEGSGWLGACCEPNMIFVVCNQFPIIATRYIDTIKGTNRTEEVVTKYRAAWDKKGGLVSENDGLLKFYYRVRQEAVIDRQELPHSAWAMAFMPWNYDLVQRLYPMTGLGFLQHIDGRINYHPRPVAKAVRTLVKEENADPNSPATFSRAREMAAGEITPAGPKFLPPAFGHIAQWVSEVGGSPDVDELLKHADTFFNPSWHEGGFYYKRNDSDWDKDGNYVHVEPYSGNAAIGYARLNVKNGQKKMWDHPWTAADVNDRPWIDGVLLEDDVDCLRGTWSEDESAIIATFRTWNGKCTTIHPVVKGLPKGTYGVYINGDFRNVKEVTQNNVDIDLALEVDESEIDIVVVRG